ncbi:unnamed protein product [Sympodiomycopsis kandeliae]
MAKPHNNHVDAESQPLLRPDGEEENAQETKPGFPWLRVSILMAMRLAEPISFSVIFPFVNPFMEELTGARNVGLYAGIIESLFMATQCTTLLFWGAQSDRRGRKPILLFGLLGSSASIVLFGLAKSFWFAVVARCLAGALNGNVAVVKSMVAEMVPKEYHPVAFSSLSVVWSLGITIGPALGGFLSQPAKEHPSWFAKDAPLGLGGLWETFPYLLPCLISGTISWLAILLGFLKLEETLPRIVKKKQKMREQQERQKLLQSQQQASPDHDAQERRLLRSPSASEHDAQPFSKRLSRLSWYGSITRRSQQNRVDQASGDNGSEPDTPPILQRKRSQRFQPKFGRVSSFYSGFTPTVSQVPSPSQTPPRRETEPVDEHRTQAIESSNHQQANDTVPEAIQRLNDSGIEQRQAQKAPQDGATPSNGNSDTTAGKDDDDRSGSIGSILKNPHIQRLLITQAFLSLTMVGLDSMQVLYFYEPVEVGGLFLTPSQTGLILALTGIFGVISQVIIFPQLQKIFGSLRLYRLALCFLPFSVVLLPLANIIARGKGLTTVTESEVAVWTPIAASNTFKILAAMGFASNMLLVNASASLFDSIRLGTLNALAQMAASASRAIGPLCFSSLLSITYTQQIWKGYFAWVILGIVACGGITTSLGLLDVEKMIKSGEVRERIEGEDEDEEAIEQEARREQNSGT